MESSLLEFRKKSLNKTIDKMMERYNPERGMLGSYHPPYAGGAGGYHTRKTGYLHDSSGNSEAAGIIFFLEREDLYPQAISIVRELIKIQDTNENSPTYGLWPYYAEEPCEEMIAPDYNMADFNARYIAYLLKKKSQYFDNETIEMMKTSLYRAAQCSINRNVSCDYTNISMMSLNTIICAGELCGDEEFFKRGKERLRKTYEYNKFCGTFSEYNSPAYGPLALEEIGRMIDLFEDEECREMAKELNYIGWKMLLSHYDTDMQQLAAPHMRCYSTLTGKGIEELIYVGTNGKYGEIKAEGLNSTGILICPPVCPDELIEKYLEKKIKRPYFLNELMYKKNNIRTPDEDTVIIRSLESPDLRAYTYIDEGFSMGIFEKIDTWTQRNNGTIYWGNAGHIRYLRLRCFNDEYDYCSGMVYAVQKDNIQLIHTGFVTDRGDFHYIIDKVKDGKLTTEKLLYLYELGGECENVSVVQNGKNFTVTDEDIEININIHDAYFDGKEMEIRYNEEKKRIEAVCFDGGKSVDFNTMENPTYMVMTVSVNEKCDAPETVISGNTVTSTLRCKDAAITLKSPVTPVAFDVAMEEVSGEIN